MEKLNEKAEACDICNEDLGRLFLLCKTCNKYLCYDCYHDHPIEHDPLPCKTLNGNKYIVMEPGEAGYGPRIEDTWPSLPIKTFFSSYHPKCQHAIDYFKEKNMVFFCHECHKWLCLDCLDDHLEHGVMLQLGYNNGNDLRQIDPNLYGSEYNLELSSNAYVKKDKIKVELEIKNDNNAPLYDLQILSTYEGYYNDEDDLFIETISNKSYYCHKLVEIEFLPPNFTTNDLSYEVQIIDHPSSIDFPQIMTIIRFKDSLLGNGRAISTTSVKNNDVDL